MISIYLYNFKNQREAQENKSTASKFVPNILTLRCFVTY